MRIETYPDRDMLAMDLADILASELESCLQTQDAASLAVPGGTTPGPIFDVLSAVHLDWAQVHVMATDERWVPVDHPRSNARLIKERLLTGPASAAPFIPFFDQGAPADVIPRQGEALARHLPISVLVLGMGEDMHTASLFPGAPDLKAALAPEAPVLCCQEPPGQPEMRVTLAGHVLAGALSKHLVILGAEKRAALDRAQHLSPADAPIRVAMTDLVVHWAE